MLTDPLFRVVNAAYFVAFFGLAARGRRGARLAGPGGWHLGVVGFAAALLGILNLGGNMWFEGFAALVAGQVVPQAFAPRRSRTC